VKASYAASAALHSLFHPVLVLWVAAPRMATWILIQLQESLLGLLADFPYTVSSAGADLGWAN
jgi:hypothetical protein